MRSSNCRQFEDSVRLVAEVALPSRRRTMRVFSNQPGLQLYTGNFLPRAGMRGKVRPRTAHTSHLTRAPPCPGRRKLHAPRRALPRDSELPRLREQPRQLPERRAAARAHLRAPAGGAAAGLAGEAAGAGAAASLTVTVYSLRHQYSRYNNIDIDNNFYEY